MGKDTISYATQLVQSKSGSGSALDIGGVMMTGMMKDAIAEAIDKGVLERMIE